MRFYLHLGLCDLSKFRCNNGKCIEKEFICDSNNDSEDNSDESQTDGALCGKLNYSFSSYSISFSGKSSEHVYVYICVCVCACLLSFKVKAAPDWMKWWNVLSELRPVILRSGNNYVPKTFISASKACIERTIILAVVQKSVN